MNNVTSNEVKDLLRRVGRGEVVPSLKYPTRTWKSVYGDEVHFVVEKWELSIFNDNNHWDYVDHVISPDGREGSFDDWCGQDEGWNQPGDTLLLEDRDIYNKMVIAFANAF